MAVFQINGMTYTGNDIRVVNDEVWVDGVKQLGKGGATGILEIKVVSGTIEKLVTDRSVNCNAVSGDVSAGGSVNCDDVGGNVKAGGSVNCDSIGGSLVAGGPVRTW
jgi:hypothetical protein